MFNSSIQSGIENVPIKYAATNAMIESIALERTLLRIVEIDKVGSCVNDGSTSFRRAVKDTCTIDPTIVFREDHKNLVCNDSAFWIRVKKWIANGLY